MGLAAAPALAFGRPPLIYHRVANVVAHPNGTVALHLSMHDVVIQVKKGDSVTVSTDIWASAGSDSAKKEIIHRLAPKVSTRGDDVVVASPRHHGWHWSFHWGGGPQARVTVTMPPTMAVKYHLGSGDFTFDNAGAPNRIDGTSGSGDVDVKSASKQLSLRTGSGDVHAALTGSPVSALLHTGSGDVRFTGAAESLKIEAGSGDITVHDGAVKNANIHTGSGDIVTHWSKVTAGGSMSATAGSGDVIMDFPPDTVLGGSISTGSGDVDSAFPVTVHGSHHDYTLAGGSGAVQLDIDTGSGDVELRKRG